MKVQKVIRRDYGQGASTQEANISDSATPSIGSDELLIDRLIYKRMASLTDNKNLTTPDTPDTDFHRWLLDMNNLWQHKYYPLLHTGPTPTPDIKALDEYLGTLGVTETYPFSEDTFHLTDWLSQESRSEYRILVDITDNTYLTDGDDVLVSYSR